mmetsp:Transcript_39543/g.106130  ORF Transcript_39543/g.106130 Transcript_39543/m.106130 type:complete len:263 (-) Transcript_39543:436-1224(-)
MALPLEHAFGGILLLRHDGRQDGAPAVAYGQPLAARHDALLRLAAGGGGAACASCRLAALLVRLAGGRADRAGQQGGQLRGGDDVDGQVNLRPRAVRGGAREHRAERPDRRERGDVEAQRRARGVPDATDGHHVGGADRPEPGHRRGQVRQRARGAESLLAQHRLRPAALPVRVVPVPLRHLLEHLELLVLHARLGGAGLPHLGELHRPPAAPVHGRQGRAEAQEPQHGRGRRSYDESRQSPILRGEQPGLDPVRAAGRPVH